jgi:hypothetical protein
MKGKEGMAASQFLLLPQVCQSKSLSLPSYESTK